MKLFLPLRKTVARLGVNLYTLRLRRMSTCRASLAFYVVRSTKMLTMI